MIANVPFIRLESADVQNKHLQLVLNNPVSFWECTYQNKCSEWLKDYFNTPVYLLDSCTEGLNVVSILLNIEKGDEIIVPSFTHVSSILPFVNRGGVPVYVDIDKENMCLDVDQVEKSICDRTKAVVSVNYGGSAPDYDRLLPLLKKRQIVLIEDNSHGLGSLSKGGKLGNSGDFALLSFEKQKNITCQEGGALVMHNTSYQERLEEIIHLGTNRANFERDEVKFYEWVGTGVKTAFTEFQAAYLLPQLENLERITSKRRQSWDYYYEKLRPLAEQGYFELNTQISDKQNAHIFYLVMKNQTQRDFLIQYLRKFSIQAQFHYYPLHLSQYGRSKGKTLHSMENTMIAGFRLLRLPIFNSISEEEQQYVVDKIYSFFNS